MFDSRYEVFLADTDAARELNYRIRYNVYCLDKGFEKSEVFADGMERDAFDEQSAHFLVRCRVTGEWVAASRLIKGQPHELPVHDIGAFDTGLAFMRNNQVAELSRICVVGNHRRQVSAEDCVGSERKAQAAQARRESEIMLGLVGATQKYCTNTDIPYVFFLITKGYARLLNRLQIQIYKVGPEVDHRGLRAPYLSSTEHAIEACQKPGHPFADVFANDRGYRLFSELEAREIPALPAVVNG